MRTREELGLRRDGRHWKRLTDPFPHYRVSNVFRRSTYDAIEGSVNAVLARGLSDQQDGGRLSRSTTGLDIFGYAISNESPGALPRFISREWHDLLAEVIGVKSDGSMVAMIHHRKTGCADGFIHNDLTPIWFVDYPTETGVTLIRPDLCCPVTGRVYKRGVKPRELVRSVTMLFYVGNAEYADGDGGTTGLYRNRGEDVRAPAAQIPPVNNSLLLFQCSPVSLHSFIGNRRSPRTTIAVWLHQETKEAQRLWGRNSIGRRSS